VLGRPFGAPNEPGFQRKVLLALLNLFVRPSGPVLDDFPHEAPATAENAAEAAFACPVNFVRMQADDGDLTAAMQCEIAQLAPWYDLALKRRGRTTYGLTGKDIAAAASYAGSYLGTTPEPPYAADITAGAALKRVCDDLKAYYYEAVAAQPGNLSAVAIEHWFWRETAAAKVFLAIQQVCLRSADVSLQPLGKTSLVPRSVLGGPAK